MKLDEIKELVEVFGTSTLDAMKIKMKDFELEMEKGGEAPAPVVVAAPAPTAVSAPAAPAPTETLENTPPRGEIIPSPMVGTYYASPSPDSPPFIAVGDTVKKGQPLCILEAMKIMNELDAEFDCTIVDILVADGEAVEYDKPLFVVEKL